MVEDSKYNAVLNALQRERLARKSAEKIIEEKSSEIYRVNQELKELNRNLEDRIIDRTKAIKESNRLLEIAKKVAEDATSSKSSFLSNMSHEIRTPLNGIIGIANLMQDEELSENALKMLDSIKYSADNLLKIINEILDFSKIEAGKISFEKVNYNLNKLLKELLVNLEFTAKQKGLVLLSQIDDDIPDHVSGDPIKLNQILTNLIGNAIKFTSSGYVKLIVKPLKEKLENGSSALYFCIKDTGIGIAEDKLATVFESFQQGDTSTTRQFGGTGLGLTISKNFVELQGGKIYAKSKLGFGSDFIFYYPYAVVDSKQTGELEKEKNYDFTPLKRRILLVEDNKLNQFVASQFLMKWGASVDIANHGKEAIYFLKKNLYDIVLMDIQMPEMNGLEATKIIRANDSEIKQRDIPIIALTANAFDETRMEISEAGMNEFVSKPLIPEILHQKIKSLICPND